MRIQVRKCSFTGKLFEEKDINKYIKHLQNIRAEHRTNRRLKNVSENFESWLHNEKLKILDFSEIPDWIIKNQTYIMEYCNAVLPKTYNHKFPFQPTTDKFEDIKLLRMYKTHASNTHSCPKNGVQNWERKPDLPNGYPGLVGTIEGKLVRNKIDLNNYPTSDLLNILGIITHGGGGGNNQWRWSVTLFLDDWPGLTRAIEEKEILSKLKGIHN